MKMAFESWLFPSGFVLRPCSFELQCSELNGAEMDEVMELNLTEIMNFKSQFATSEQILINSSRYLVPAELTVGQFVCVVRKRVDLSPEKAIFVFAKNILPPTVALMSIVYDENKDDDGFLCMTYSGENVFGLSCSEAEA